jgi:DNA repair protein RadA/Sms
VKPLEDIVSAEKDRIRIEDYDYIFGGGIVKTSVTLLGGGPGAGKSTMILQLAALVCDAVCRDALYIAAEEAPEEIKARAERIIPSYFQERTSKIQVFPALSGVANLGASLQKFKPGFIILDSLQGLCGSNNHEAAESALKVLKTFSSMFKAPVVVISQLTKGDEYAGLKAHQHAVDALMKFDVDDDQIRVIETEKNRNGKAFIQTYFEMTNEGLVCLAPLRRVVQLVNRDNVDYEMLECEHYGGLWTKESRKRKVKCFECGIDDVPEEADSE